MHPWERRLGDVLSIFDSCSKTYFEPELFRRNINQFLQTARTVTFLISKNKEQIPNFDDWHKENILEKWKGDEIMKWSKESRNFIEKEGDLEIHSKLEVSLIFSYRESEDVTINIGKEELLLAGIKN